MDVTGTRPGGSAAPAAGRADGSTTTARLLVYYDLPADPQAFDRHYREVHLPLARRLPGLRRYLVSRRPDPVRGPACYLLAELEWDTLDDLRAAFASDAGRATAADAARLQQLAPMRSMIIGGAEDVLRSDPPPEV